MKSCVVDFETFWSDDYTLTKMTTEAYVRDPRFQTILCGFKIGNDKAYWVPGPEVTEHLHKLKLEGYAVIAHHAHFDGLILSHHYGVVPGYWIDTLSMARALYGSKGKNSLAKLAERHGIGVKGEEVILAKGKHYADFSKYDLTKYGMYCCNDCDMEHALAKILGVSFQRQELDLIDATVRMFTEPVLQLRADKLQKYIAHLNMERNSLLMQANVQLCDITSNKRFADVLTFLGIEVPMKVSKTTGRPTYAFAKTDEAMMELAEHDDELVQAVIAARINAKSTINQTRAERLIDMSGRGPACVYINHAGAGQTMRASGGDKMNWQNFTRGGMLREAVEAPPGYELTVGDSSNIESRMLDYLAGQDDQLEAYRAYDAGIGPDIYCVMAEKIYGRVIDADVDKDERFLGKTTKLGLGYGMGFEKFMVQVRQQSKRKITLAPLQAANIVALYRTTHAQVMKLHHRCEQALGLISMGRIGAKVDYRGIITVAEDGLALPNGLVIKYADLQHDPNQGWSYFNGKTRQKIYGGKVVENVVQALARIVVMYQTLQVPRRLVLSVHDEGVWCVPVRDVIETEFEVSRALRTPPPWAPDLPLNCEVGSHKSYGRAKS
jgi:DNA polymerase I-like protein with 3'-5' exonuclease and polymerase domains